MGVPGLHLEKRQVGELLDIVAIAHAVVAEDVAVVPEFLDEGTGVHVYTRGRGADAVVMGNAIVSAELCDVRLNNGKALFWI